MGKHVKPSEKKNAVPPRLRKFTDSVINTADDKNDASAKLVTAGYAGEIALVSAAFLVLAIFCFIPLADWLRVLIFIVPLGLMGYPVFIKAYNEVINLELTKPNIVFSLAAISAMALKKCVPAVTLLGLYRLCILLIDFVEARHQRMIRAYDTRWPETANIENGNDVFTYTVRQVEIGNVVEVKPGEYVPVDGVVVDGSSSFKTDTLTGDGPVYNAAPGCDVFSGFKNVTNPVRVQASRDCDGSLAFRIKKMVEYTAEDKTRRLYLLNKLGVYFPYFVLILAVLIAVIMSLITEDWDRWLSCGVVFLIAAEPAAVLLSIPLTYSAGVYGAADAGIFISNIDSVEHLSRTHTFVMEKTGIITDGEFRIEEVYTEGIDEEKLLDIAAAVECNANHPIAEAICLAGNSEAYAADQISDYFEVPGKGVSAIVDGMEIIIGTASMLTDNNILYKVPNKPGAAIHVAIDNIYRGYFLISDNVRGRAFDALEALRVLGVSSLVLLTGDVKSSARPVASSLNFDMVKYELSPQGKTSAVEYLMEADHGRSSLTFVGDGSDDQQAMQCADVGIAFDALRRSKLIDSADVIILDDNIQKIPLAMKICRFTDRIAIQNIIAFAAVKLLELVGAVFGFVGIWFAIACEVVLLVFSLINVLRTLKEWV